MSAPVTISQLDRLAICPAGASMRQVVTHRPEAETARGTAWHAFLEDVVLVGREAALQRHAESEWFAEFEGANLDDLPQVQAAGLAELPMALDPEAETARALGRNGSQGRRAYGVGPGEVPGTPDWFAPLDDGSALVLDLKTGWGPLAHPADSLQLLGYALGAASILEVDEVTVGFMRGPDSAGEFRLSTARLDSFALASGWDRLRTILRRVADGPLSPLVLGQHCRYCPAALVCPAQASLLRELAQGELHVDPAKPALAYELVKTAEQTVKRARERLDDLARQMPIQLQDGRTYGEVLVEREHFDAAKAEVLLAGHPLESAVERAAPKLSKESLNRAAKRHVEGKKGEKMAPLVRDALERLRAGDAAGVSVHPEMRAFGKAKKKEESDGADENQ